MQRVLKGAAVLTAGLAAIAGTTVPAGSSNPFQVRVVTMNGVRGPAYYSRAAQSYRFVSPPTAEGVVASFDAEAAR